MHICTTAFNGDSFFFESTMELDLIGKYEREPGPLGDFLLYSSFLNVMNFSFFKT